MKKFLALTLLLSSAALANPLGKIGSLRFGLSEGWMEYTAMPIQKLDSGFRINLFGFQVGSDGVWFGFSPPPTRVNHRHAYIRVQGNPDAVILDFIEFDCYDDQYVNSAQYFRETIKKDGQLSIESDYLSNTTVVYHMLKNMKHWTIKGLTENSINEICTKEFREENGHWNLSTLARKDPTEFFTLSMDESSRVTKVRIEWNAKEWERYIHREDYQLLNEVEKAIQEDNPTHTSE